MLTDNLEILFEHLSRFSGRKKLKTGYLFGNFQPDSKSKVRCWFVLLTQPYQPLIPITIVSLAIMLNEHIQKLIGYINHYYGPR